MKHDGVSIVILAAPSGVSHLPSGARPVKVNEVIFVRTYLGPFSSIAPRHSLAKQEKERELPGLKITEPFGHPRPVRYRQALWSSRNRVRSQKPPREQPVGRPEWPD